MYAVGYSLAGWLGFACFYMSPTDPHVQFSWRFPLAFQCFFPLVLLAGYKLVPYSPRWLLSKGRRDEAWEVVKRLHATKADVNNLKAKEEFYLIEKQYEMDSQLPNRFLEIFRTAPNRRRALVAFLLMMGDQVSFQNVVESTTNIPGLIVLGRFRACSTYRPDLYGCFD